MATKLRKIRYNRVDLVDKGANPLAHVMIVKREMPSDRFMQTLNLIGPLLAQARALDISKEYDAQLSSFGDELASQAAHRQLSKVSDLWFLFSDVAHRIICDASGTARAAMLQQSAQEFAAAVEAAMTEVVASLELTPEEAVTKAMLVRAVQVKKQAVQDSANVRRSGETDMTDEQVQKRIDDALAAAKTETDAAIAKAREDGKAEAAAEIKKANDRAQEAETIAKAERDQRVTKELTDFAKSIAGVPTIVVDGEKSDVVLFKRLKDALTPEDFARVQDILTKSAEAIKTSAAMTEVGATGTSAARVPESLTGEIDQVAADLMKTDATLKTKEQAIAKIATSSDPKHIDLMKRYEDARRGKK